MTQKLRHMNVSPKLVLWVDDSLTKRNEYVKIGNITSTVSTTNTDATQDCVVSPILFSLYTSDCKPIRENSNDILVKHADAKCFTGLITNNDETAYLEEIGKLSTRCSANYLEFNTKKSKQMIVDFRKKKQTPPTLVSKMKPWSV